MHVPARRAERTTDGQPLHPNAVSGESQSGSRYGLRAPPRCGIPLHRPDAPPRCGGRRGTARIGERRREGGLGACDAGRRQKSDTPTFAKMPSLVLSATGAGQSISA